GSWKNYRQRESAYETTTTRALERDCRDQCRDARQNGGRRASLSSEGFPPHCVNNLTQIAGRMADPWIAPMVAGVGHASGRSIACESGSPQRRGPAHGRRGGAPGHEVRVPPPRKPPVESGVPGASKTLVIVGVALQAALLIDFARPQPRARLRAGQCR